MALETDRTKESRASSCKKVFKNECLDCEKYQRKIKENERTVSARDVLIEMSQKEIQKLQNLYKNSIDEYETLRFTYCSTVQDFSNLKDIHKKLEEEHRTLLVEKKTSSAKMKDFDALKSELEYWRNQYEKLQKFKGTCDCANKEKCLEKKAQADVLNIQNILQNQNQSVKLLLSKFLDELKESKFDQKINKSCQVGCRADITTSDEGLRQEINKLNSLVEKLTVENKKIKENLNDKQTHLFKCLNVLEKNHSDIGNLSGHIENICTERDKCLLAIDDKDREICGLKCQLNHLKESTANIEDLKLEKERYFQENKKLRNVIDTFRADTEKKDKIIDEVDNEKENLHKELGKFRRISEALQDEIETKFDSEFVEQLNREIETLKNENERYVDDLDKLTKEWNAKAEEVEEMTSTIQAHFEKIKKLKYIIRQNRKNAVEKNETNQTNDVTDNENDNELETLKEKYTKLRQEMTVKEEKQKEVENRLREKIKQLQENVNDLGETLSIITEENRSNLKTIENLRESLNESQQEHEKIECRGKCAIHELKNEIEDLKTQLEQLKSPPHIDEEIENITDYGEPNEEFVKLQEKIKLLEKDLENANLEIAEYEEENKAFRQKIEAMTNDVNYLHEEKLRTEDDISERLNNLKQEYTKLLSEKEDKIVELQNDIFNKTGDPTTTQNEISKLRDDIKTIEQEKAQLESEKTNLIGKIVKLESELEQTYHETKTKVSSLVEKLESVEGHNGEMKKELKCCCEEMSIIKETLKNTKTAKDCDNRDFETKCMIQDAEILKLRNVNLEQAQQIENLQNSIQSYQKRLQNCDCSDSESEGSQDDNEELKKNVSVCEDLNEELRTKIRLLEGELCSKKCMIISLEKCIDKSNRILGDCEEEIKKINAENQRLKNDLDVMKGNIERMNCEIDVHRADKDLLQEKVQQCRSQSQELEANNVKLLRKTSEDQKMIEDKISVLQQKYNNLLEESEAKDMELDKIKKQFQVLQSCCKSPSISKEEFQKMKRVSREIKDLLIEQSKKLSETTEKTAKVSDDARGKCLAKKYVADLEEKIKNKESDMKYLESKNNSMSTEILDLKRHVHTLMLDNIELKRDITNLLNTVITKVRLITTSGENLDMGTSRDTAATGVLNSLIQLEKGMLEDTKPNGCPISSCNCMSLIKAKYSNEENDSLVSKPPASVDEGHENVAIPKTSLAGCMREISKAYGICYENQKAESEEEIKSEKECTKSLDQCSTCEAPCSDINKNVPCSEKKTQERKSKDTPQL